MTSYPQTIDNDSDLPAVNDNITEIGGEAINALRAAVFSLEKTLGTNPQGSTATMDARLSASINSDGTIRAAALIAAGLIALPITNSQVGASAGIKETKLDLDVSTQGLQDQVSSNDIDIVNLQKAIANVLNDFTQHINGTAFRHDGYDIDLAGGLSGASAASTVGDALHFLRNTFLVHRSTQVTGEHFARAITYVPVADGAITATNVQDAIEGVEADFI